MLLDHAGIPMKIKSHMGMLRFAERKTGILEIDNARVQRILVPREYGKSTMITKARTLQHIMRNCDHTVGIGNETLLMAKGFLGEIKAVFENNDLFKVLFPELVPDNFHDVRWAADQMDCKRTIHRKEPTVLAAGVDRNITGVHMKEWILDDIMSTEAAENARTGSFSEIEKVKRWMNRLEPLCDGPGTPITIIGTPWWDGDCYDHAADLWGEGLEPILFNWILQIPELGETQHYELELQGELATFRLPAIKDGHLTFPEKWPEKRIAVVQRNDPQLFAANLMLEPSSELVRDFKDDWLLEYFWDTPARIRYRDNQGESKYVQVRELDCVMAVDPAISESIKADRTGIVVSGTLDGVHHILLEASAQRLGVLDLCKTIEFRYAEKKNNSKCV